LFVLGHPPNPWRVCAAVNVKIDEAVKIAETETMVASCNEMKNVNW
jgi:hypothetical protein